MGTGHSEGSDPAGGLCHIATAGGGSLSTPWASECAHAASEEALVLGRHPHLSS